MNAVLVWLLVLMTATLCAGIWIGPALIGTGIVLLEMFTNLPTHKVIANWSFNVLTSSDIVSLPLFILMGELLFRTRLSQSLFSGIAPWMSFLPGRLFHTTVIGCSMFAAISGSSVATAATFSAVSALYWMLASMIQYQAFAALVVHPFNGGSVIVTIIGIVPLVLYTLVCLFFFRGLERRLRRPANSDPQQQAE